MAVLSKPTLRDQLLSSFEHLFLDDKEVQAVIPVFFLSKSAKKLAQKLAEGDAGSDDAVSDNFVDVTVDTGARQLHQEKIEKEALAGKFARVTNRLRIAEDKISVHEFETNELAQNTQTRLAELTIQIEQLQDDIKCMITQQQDANATIHQRELEKEELARHMTKLTDQLRIAEDKSSVLQTEITGQVKDSQTCLSELTNQNAKLEGDIKDLISQQQEAEATIASLRSQNEVIGSELNRQHTDQLSEASSQVELLWRKQDELEVQGGALKEELAAQLEVEKRIRAENEESKERSKAEERCSMLESELANLRAALDGISAKSREYQVRTETLEKESEKSDADNKEELSKANERCFVLESKIMDIMTELEAVAGRAEAFQQHSQKLATKNTSSDADKKEMKRTIHNVQAQNKTLKSKLMELSQVIVHLSLEMQQSVDGMRGEKNQIQADFENQTNDERAATADIQSHDGWRTKPVHALHLFQEMPHSRRMLPMLWIKSFSASI